MVENWIVPCNTKYYDVVNHLEKNEYIVWRRVSAIRKGDIVYLYLALPYQEIKYRCIVVDDDVTEELLMENTYAIKKSESGKRYHYIRLKKDFEYGTGTLSLAKLKENGLGQTQTQARTDRKLQAFIDRVNAELGINK